MRVLLTIVTTILFLQIVQSCTYNFVFQYAPLIWLAKNETYLPSSVQYIFNNTHLETINNVSWLVTNQKLKEPSSTLPYFSGQYISPVYAFILPNISEQYPIQAIQYPLSHNITVVYFTIYPYNRGKEVVSTIWGNHVGDIEHVTVRFSKGIPVDVEASYHQWSIKKLWGDPTIEMIPDSTHFVLYSALGSHGLYFNSGPHQYHTDPDLIDQTSKGLPWISWKHIQLITPYDWNVTWINQIYRWGNPASSFPINNCYFGQCRLEDGPTGPLDKSELHQVISTFKNYICNGCEWNAGIFN